MFAMMPTPIFSFGHDASSLYRPAVSSPLSSSPVRATSTSPQRPNFAQHAMSSPLSERDPNICTRNSQSSPIFPSGFEDTNGKRKTINFKYAGRDTRPNPVVKKREDKQETRRRLFLQNVRQRADDKKWERRDGENELLKLEWLRLNRERRLAMEYDQEAFIREEDIEELYRDTASEEQEQDLGMDLDSMMLDAIEQQEEAELDALLSSALPSFNQQQQISRRPESPAPSLYSDEDDDYDTIFMDFISSQQGSQSMAMSQPDVEMS